MERARSNRVLAALFLAVATLAHAGLAHAQTLEYAVKANYLVRFAVFVQWPSQTFASPDSPVVICVTGRDPFGAVLADAAGAHTAEGRRIVARALRVPDRVAGCHMVYVGFHIDNDAAVRAGLNISSRLLSLALSVTEDAR